MTTAFEAIEDAALAALNTPTPVAAQVGAWDNRPLAENKVDAVAVHITGGEFEDAGLIGGRVVSNSTELVVTLQKRGPVGHTPAKSLGTLLAAVGARLGADPTLGGLIGGMWVSELQYGSQAGAEQANTCTLTYRLVHEFSPLTFA